MRTLLAIVHSQLMLAHPIECLDEGFDDYEEPIPATCSACGRVCGDEDARCDDCGGLVI